MKYALTTPTSPTLFLRQIKSKMRRLYEKQWCLREGWLINISFHPGNSQQWKLYLLMSLDNNSSFFLTQTFSCFGWSTGATQFLLQLIIKLFATPSSPFCVDGPPPLPPPSPPFETIDAEKTDQQPTEDYVRQQILFYTLPTTNSQFQIRKSRQI